MDKHVLVYICNNGYANEAIEKARKVGARGGTILHGRTSVDAANKTFFGITIHSEKDVLMIVCNDDQKEAIINTINEHYGAQSEARGILFSIPIDKTIGIDLKQTFKGE